MQKQIKILLTLLIALFLSVSCSKDNVTNPIKTKEQMLQQKWQDNDTTYGTSQYVITTSKFDSLYNNSTSYSFDIKHIKWTSDTAGIIYGQYTANTYSPEVVGKWYAVSFKDLTETTIKICGASKGSDFSAENFIEAISKFTEANGYFGTFSDCTAVR
ncbi:hypothetical protein BHAMNSH16_14115 [Brachyspira hampsonii]|uniref:Uncharacterized protein n=3 Tax=Brachyspira hampsonii TaxID=1287055 RepID=A0AAC9TXQ7_9SPIR|nr:hypothetical protein [Brachyspira hampsonii]ASJ22716.1 hypothetical protein BHAMNSH16_14115 [Brachyspira hampsonii]MBW5381560.1 hypothetical protein [Brachyspira hampsonii]MBW5410838.1 hypothetical protein [Brachyspira hampsonii]OEJ19800.1 hypothetical protein A9496_03250 [Brachyspira hampsonii]